MKNGPFFPLVYVHSFCIRSTPCSALGRHFINPRWRTSRLQNYGKRVWRRGSTRLAIQSRPRHGAHPEPLTRYLPRPGVSAPRALLTGNTRFLPNSGTRPSSGPGRRPRSARQPGARPGRPRPHGRPAPRGFRQALLGSRCGLTGSGRRPRSPQGRGAWRPETQRSAGGRGQC